MARALRPLSPDPTVLLAKVNLQTRLAVVNSEIKAQPAVDLEDGEITEEKPETPRVSAKVEPDTSTAPLTTVVAEAHEPTPLPLSNPKPDEPKPPPATLEVDSPEPPLASPLEVEASEMKAPHALSEEELNLAKSIVLDLLGWGVQPEYLIECGVSSHAIYKIFTDLNLRLPMNLSYFG